MIMVFGEFSVAQFGFGIELSVSNFPFTDTIFKM